jgi:hypothetical protein
MNHSLGLRYCFTRKPVDYEIISDGKGYWQYDQRVRRSLRSTAKVSDVLAAVVACSAVLVIFLQLGSGLAG